MNKKTRVLILEDHPGIVGGYHLLLDTHLKIEIIATISYGEQLEPTLKKYPADILLLDVNVPESEENPNPYPILHLIPKLLETYSRLHVLVISMFAERGLIHAVLESGASGYILKDDQKAYQALGEIILSIADEGVYFSEKVEALIDPKKTQDTLALTKRQKEALSLYAAFPDASGADIGGKMGISHSSVRNLLSTAYLRLKVRTRAAAVAKARQLGLITPNEPVSRV
jgi:DNA-binding NarL/FixJ family response regulator